MQEPSVFTRIINGDIPSYKIYEDEMTYAFLDIHPNTYGQTLVIPKKQFGVIYHADEATLTAIMLTAQKVSLRIEKVLAPGRVAWVVHGFGVPNHAHIKLVPVESEADTDHDHLMPVPSEAEFTELMEKLRF